MLQDRAESATAKIADYWNRNLHDRGIARSPAGAREYFAEMDAYRFQKLRYLPRIVDFDGYSGQSLLEVGCGVGIDLIRFARGGAEVTGIDASEVAIDLAFQNFSQQGLPCRLGVMSGEELAFPGDCFDVVYSHSTLQYTADPEAMVREIHRVLRPGGEAILMVYNRFSWLNALSKVCRVDLEHHDAPAFHKHAIGEFRSLLRCFVKVRIIPERFPVPTRLHGGLKARLYNELFVKIFGVLPKRLTRPFGWHLMAFATKAVDSAEIGWSRVARS
ncbi:MAG TPA: class I SAM-dependent methyltransferase [Acidobacteriota bacterium]|nr:class I SAM-dependent methyltransferase [Acidobacteriota bacterium]